jgi:ATP-dependent protease ClpP protease subunit
MPARAEIQKEIESTKKTAQDTVRRRFIHDLAKYTGRDTIIYMSGFTSIKAPLLPPTIQSITVQDIQGFMAALNGLKSKELDLIIHSPGGSLEAADQIVQYLRSKFDHIRAIIPQNAMSAATMISCACDEIIMGKQSAIGPIDPQITLPGPHGQVTAPAQSILDDFEKAKSSIIEDPRTAPLWITRINSLPPGILKICNDTIDNAKSKVTEWLDSYMFKNTDKKGSEIAEWLGSATEHKTHGRPIGIKLAQNKGLVVKALEDDQELQEKVLSVFHAAAVTLDITPIFKFIENHKDKGWFMAAELMQSALPIQQQLMPKIPMKRPPIPNSPV